MLKESLKNMKNNNSTQVKNLLTIFDMIGYLEGMNNGA